MPKKNILFLGYWSVSDPLSVATTFPHLSILTSFENIDKVVYCSLERGEKSNDSMQFDMPGVKHIPLHSKNNPITLLNKIGDFAFFRRDLARLMESESINGVLARGSLAGALILPVCKKLGIPLYVESFEPHAQYMLESRVWKNWDPRYIFQKRWERKLKIFTAGLMPVSKHYTKQLIKEGIAPEKIRTVPCSVNPDVFQFNERDRIKTREKLGLDADCCVGIYVGKLGGLYMNEEALQIFKTSFNHIENLKLIVLTSQDRYWITDKFVKQGINPRNLRVNRVPHDRVATYLSAADFGYCIHRPGPSSTAFSPIKNAEYWANGLPILIPDGVGDDSKIISQEGGGSVYDLEIPDSLIKALESLKNIIDDPDSRREIPTLAAKYRSITAVMEAYQYFLLSK